MELKGLIVNFLGDSITQGVGTTPPDGIYLNMLKKEKGLKEIRNYGISGTRFAYQQVPDGLDAYAFTRRFMVMDDDAVLVVVFGGTNDFGHGDAPVGTMNDRTPETFYGACHFLFSGLIKKYLGKPVIIMTPLHRTEEMLEPESGVRYLKTYVDIIREVAEYYSLPVLDLYATAGIQPTIPEVQEKYMPDGLHPNTAGHEIIAYK